MTSVEAAEVVDHRIQVVLGGNALGGAVSLHEALDVQAFKRELNQLVNFFLLAHLSVSQIEKSTFSVVSRLFALKPFNLYNQDFGHFEKFELLVNVPVLLALAAVPLVISREQLVRRELFKALLYLDGLVVSFIIILSLDLLVICSQVLCVGIGISVDHHL